MIMMACRGDFWRKRKFPAGVLIEGLVIALEETQGSKQRTYKKED